MKYQAGTAYIRISPDMRGFKDKLEKQVHQKIENMTARVDLDSESARAELRSLQDEAENIRISPDLDRKATQKVQRQLDNLAKKNRKLALDAEVHTLKAEREIERLGKRQKINLEVGLNDSVFNRQFEKMRRKLAKTNIFGDEAEKASRRALDRALKADDATANRLKAEQKLAKLQDRQNRAQERHEKKLADLRARSGDAVEKAEAKTEKARVRRYERETKARMSQMAELEKAIKRSSRSRQAERAEATFAAAQRISLRNAPPRPASVGMNRRQENLRINEYSPDNGSAVNRVRERVRDSALSKSRIEDDTSAIANATQAATAYDRAQARLQQTTTALTRAERELDSALVTVNGHRNSGTTATNAGIAALERERSAIAGVVEQRRRHAAAQAEESHNRSRYNSAAGQLEDRININPLQRMSQTFGNQLSRGVDAFTDRLIFSGRILSAVSSLGMAAGAALAGLGAVNLVPLVGSLGQVAGVLSILPAMAAGAAAAIAAIAVGVSGISDAFKMGTKASDAARKASSGGAADNSARQLRDAQKAAAKTAESGARSIASAEKGVTQAQKQSRQAQEDVTRARKDARREIEDMNRALKGLALDEEDAALSIEEARENLADVMSDPEASSTDRKRANLSYRQAVANLEDLRVAQQRQREETALANAKGVDGADSVVQAQDRAKDAAESVAEAQTTLAQTQADAADANADAQERIADAMSAAAGGTSAAATAAAEYEEALKKLSPSARAFVVGMRSMGDEWLSLRKSVQENLFGGLAGQITEVAERQLPTLRAGLGDVAGEINGGLRHALTYLASEKSALDLSTIFDNSADASGALTRGLSNLLQAFIPLSAVGSDFLPRMAEGFEDSTREFAAFINKGQESGTLLSYMTEMTMKAKEISSLFFDLGSIIRAVFVGSMDQGDSMLKSLAGWADETERYVNSAEGLERIGDFFAGSQATLGNFLRVLGDIGSVLGHTVVPAFQTASSVLGPFVRFFFDSIQAIDGSTGAFRGLLTVLLAYKAISLISGLITGMGRTLALAGAAATGNTAKFTQLSASHARAGQAAAVHTGIIGRLTASLTAMGTAATAAGARLAAAGGAGAVAARGITGAGKAASGFMGAIGGPAALGLMAAVYGFMQISSAADKAKNKVYELKDAQVAYSDSINDTNKALRASRGDVDSGVLESLTRGTDAIIAGATANKNSKKSSSEGIAEDIFATMKNPLQFLTGGGQEDAKADAAYQKAASDGKALLDLMNKMELKSDDLSLALSRNDGEWWKFRNSLLANGEAGHQLVAMLDPLRQNFKDQQIAIQSLEPGYLDLADAITVMADASATAADKTDAFRDSLDALIPGNEEREAMAQLSETIDEITAQLTNVDASKGIGSELVDNMGGVNTSTTNGVALNNMLKDLSTEAYRNAQAGGDMTAVWAQIDEKLAEAQVAFQLTDEEAQQLRKTYQLLPSVISTQVGMSGADAVLQDLNALTAKFTSEDLTKPVTKRVELKDMNSEEVLKQLGATTKVIDATKGIVEVTMDNADVLAKFQDVQSYMAAINLMQANSTVDLNTGTFTVNAQYAKQVLDILGGMRPSPEVNLLMEKLRANQPIALSDLQAITDKGAYPPVVLTQMEKFNQDVDAAQTKLDGLSMGKKLSLSIETQLDQERNPQPEWNGPELPFGVKPTPGARPPGGYFGGRIPMFATGGRLPTTGPGTEKRDGIYATGPDGLARAMVNGGEWVINSAMSKKYDPLLGAINADSLPGFEAGGILGGGPLPSLGDPFAALNSGLSMLGSQFQSILPGQAIPAFQQFGQQLYATTNSLVSPAFSGIANSLTGLQTQFPTVAGIVNPVWAGMAQGIADAKTATIDPTFTGIQGGISTVGTAFGMGVENIRVLWDGIKPATADPARFAVNDVFNNGIVGMWNSVSDLLGTARMNPYPIAFATGGVLPGYTPGRDVHMFSSPTGGQLALSGGEAIMRPEWTAAVGGPSAVEAMNAAARSGALKRKPRTDQYSLGRGVKNAFAAGGTIQGGAEITSDIQRTMWDAVRTAFPNVILTSGTRYADVGSGFDNHMGQRALDLAGPMPEIARWIYQMNQTQPVEELIHAPLQGWQNLEGGQPFNFGAGTDADHYDHVHWAMAQMVDNVGKMISMAMGSGPASRKSTGQIIEETLNPLREAVSGKIGSTNFPGMIGQLPGALFGKMNEALTAKVKDLATKYSGPAVAGGDSVERWRPMVIEALKRNGFEPNKRNQDLMLSQIASESGGDPAIVQGVQDVNSGGNEAQGLLQIIPGTFAANRDPSLPNDRTDPWANMNAALRYYRATYGDDLGTNWGRGHGYDKGGLWESGTFGFNTSGATEAVLTNPEWLKFQELISALRDPSKFASFIGMDPKKAPAPTAAPDAAAQSGAALSPGLPADTSGNPALPTAPDVSAADLSSAGLAGTEQKSMFADYNGPLSQQLRQGELIGQLGSALAQPDAMMKLTNPSYLDRQAVEAKNRQKALEDYKAQKSMQVATMRTEGKTAEADALERDNAKELELSEMPGTTPGTQARLATMSDQGSQQEQLRKQTEDSFKKYLSENAMGIAESVFAFGAGAIGNSGIGAAAAAPSVVVNGGVHTTNWKAAQRDMDKRARRASRANSRVGRR